MHQIKLKGCVRIHGLCATVVTVVVAVALNSSCLFDTTTHLCEPSGLRCGSGWVCAARQDTCIPIGGCGDGIVNSAEVCDDGNVVDGDGCSADCKSIETCGNGVLDHLVGELCDDGNRVSGDGCSADCTLELQVCGNGIVEMGEQCDDGRDSLGCNSDCTFFRCGDKYINLFAGEQCDEGLETTTCDSDCTLPKCGDGHLNPFAEICDKGPPQVGCPGQICNRTCSACI